MNPKKEITVEDFKEFERLKYEVYGGSARRAKRALKKKPIYKIKRSL